MDERRRAELLIIRLRWPAIIAGAFMLDDYVLLTPTALVAILAVVLYNAVAAQIATDKNLFAKDGHILASVSRILDLVAITFAVSQGGFGSQNLYLMYGFVIVGAGYAYNRLAPTVIALGASLVLDSFVVHLKCAVGANELGIITQHAAAHFAAALIAAYIIAFRRQDESMRIKERKLSALFECGTRFTSSQDLDQLLSHVLETAISETGAAGGSIMLLDHNRVLVTTVAKDIEDVPADERVDIEASNWVLSAGQPVMLNPGAGEEAIESKEYVRRPVICIPLVERATSKEHEKQEHAPSKIIGTLSVFGGLASSHFTHEDLDLLRTLAIHASMGAVNAKLYREIHDTFLKTLQSLARSLEARDPYTQGHSYRVSEISQLVATRLGLATESTEILRNSALLHDIGKIGVPDSVLQKPGRLTPEERLVIQTHPVTGENICRPLDLSDEVLFLIRHHQERLNGSGYPDQLPDSQQPLPLRILCAVDALDAMSSDRPYRKALSATERVEQLNRGAGSEFDPIVVEVLKDLLLSGELDKFYKKPDENGENDEEKAA